MRVIKFTAPGKWPLIRQSLGGSGCWDDCLFNFTPYLKECDWWVVYEGMEQEEMVLCPPGNTIFITGEAADFRPYKPSFLAQFGTVLTARPDIIHPNRVVIGHSSLWHVGFDSRSVHMLPRSNPNATPYQVQRTYDYYKDLDWQGAKTKDCSFITSCKSFLPGHRERLAFTQQMLNRMYGRVSVFGAGLMINGQAVDLDDKEHGILPYKYHLVVENEVKENYYTEKLLDCYLCGALPIYYGCPNVENYFPADAIVQIDIRNPDDAIRIIEETIASNLFEQSLDAIAEARRRVLDEYNIFPLVAQYAARTQAPRQPIRLLPESAF